MSDNIYADGQGSEEVVYKPSSHQFTDPIRLFKANDPYYWELDNVPLEQLHENILWLKDQVGGDTLTQGNTRADFVELRPTATGDSREVVVSPGRFTGRVNDAFQTGISTLVLKTAANMNGNPQNEIEITTPVETMKSLAGAIVTNILADNGLYDTVQHNVTSPGQGDILNWTNTYTPFVQNNKSSEQVLDLQKNKLALWKQATTVKNYGGDTNSEVDLQQLAVDFTRVYGAPFRTALVSVPSPLSIDVPSFNDSDYSNSTSYVPSVRVDLLFVYTKPVDASATRILSPNGTGPTKIDRPVLGLVKGAGLISLNAQPGGSVWSGKTLDEEFFESSDYTDNADNSNLRFEGSGAFDSLGNRQTASVISDLNQTTIGVAETYANFPSPDDLLNAAPYITDGVAKNSLALVGQSVLPLAYIFVKKDKATIETSDILDIRPFFRTAELTYNERAGLAAANPPTSLANPVVSKYELADTTKKIKTYVIENKPDIPQYPRPVGTGYVFGGIKYGPEGCLIRMMADKDAWSNRFTGNINSQQDISEHLKSRGYIPNVPGNIPWNPDWDTPQWVGQEITTGDSVGDTPDHRMDRIYFWYQGSRGNTYKFSEDSAVAWDQVETGNAEIVRDLDWIKESHSSDSGGMWFGVKKKIELDKSQVPWMTDYDVKVTLQNCSLNSTYGVNNTGTLSDEVATWKAPVGLYVEKYKNYFYIVCCWVPEGPKNHGNYPHPAGGAGKVGGAPPTTRDDRSGFGSNVYVTGMETRIQQNPNTNTLGPIKGGDPGLKKTAKYMDRNALCTYPTVKFEIVGYPSTYTNNIKIDTGTNDTITLLTSSEP
tara:strand:- start:99 stop:2579 length:2481 start_codon:yes stop_codon:yes gene_type:complete